MRKTMHAAAETDVPETSDGGSESERRSRVAEAWRVATAHMRLGEIPIEQLDIGDPLPGDAAPPANRADDSAPLADAAPASDHAVSEAEIDESGDDSFPASDPPSWPRSHS